MEKLTTERVREDVADLECDDLEIVDDPRGPIGPHDCTGEKKFDTWLAEYERDLREKIAEEIRAGNHAEEDVMECLYLGAENSIRDQIAAQIVRGDNHE